MFEACGALRPASAPASPQQLELGLAQRFGFGDTGVHRARSVKPLHQQARAFVCHRPEAGDHRLGALALHQFAKALQLLTVGSSSAQCCLAGRQGQQLHAREKVRYQRDSLKRQPAPVAKQQIRIAFVAQQEVAGDVHQRVPFAQRLQRVKRQNEGGGAFDERELSVFGWTIKDAIRFALNHLRRTRASVSIESAINQLLETKRAAGRGERYCRDVGIHLGRLAKAFAGRKVAEITTADLEGFLAGLQLSAETRNTYRRDISTLWHFAEKHGWAQAAKNTETATAIDKPPGIFTPEPAAALLSESQDVAFHAIGLFAGLRVSEIHALDWRDVDLAGGYIHVGAKISKTRSRRLVPILPNLLEWLQPVAKPAGPVVEPNLRRRHEAARARAGITQWPDNVMRHSFVSYRLATTGNAAQTALESGHDQAILFAHYRELVRPKDAERYFSIRPSFAASEKIVSLPVVAA
jgi:integrase